MGKLIKIAAVLLVVVLVGLGVVLFTDFEAPKLGQALIRMASERSGIEIEADRFALNLRRGLVLEGVTVRSEANGEKLEATLDRLLLEHRLGPLLRGDVVIERVILERPQIVMLSADPSRSGESPPSEEGESPEGAGGPAPPAAEETSDSRLHLEIGELLITDARFESRTRAGGDGVTIVEALDISLGEISADSEAESAIVGLSGRGEISIGRIEVDDLSLDGLQAELEVARGRYRIGAFEARAPAGLVAVSALEVDLAQNPYRYRLRLDVDPLDLNQVVGVDGGFGPVDLGVDASGEGPGIVGVVAEMDLGMQAGTLPSVPLLQSIDRLLGTSLDSAAYEATRASISLAAGRLDIEPIEFVTEIATLGLQGSIDFQEHYDLKIEVRIPRDLFSRADEVSEDVLDALTRREWLVVPLVVTGEIGSPRFGPDMDVLREVIGRTASQARDRLVEKARAELSGAIRRIGRGR